MSIINIFIFFVFHLFILWVIPGVRYLVKKIVRESKKRSILGLSLIFSPPFFGFIFTKDPAEVFTLFMLICLIMFALTIMAILGKITSGKKYMKFGLLLILIGILTPWHPFSTLGAEFFGVFYRYDFFIVGNLSAIVFGHKNYVGTNKKSTQFSVINIMCLFLLFISMHFLIAELAGNLAISGESLNFEMGKFIYHAAYFSVFYLIVTKYVVFESIENVLENLSTSLSLLLTYGIALLILQFLINFHIPGISYNLTLVALLVVFFAGTTDLTIPWVVYTLVFLISTLFFNISLT